MRASPGCEVPWRDEVLAPLLVKEAGRARVSAPPASWFHALVAMGVVCHHLANFSGFSLNFMNLANFLL